jgi:hypothetical protein
LAADDRGDHFHVSNIFRVHGKQVVAENDDVGQLAGRIGRQQEQRDALVSINRSTSIHCR